MAGFAGLGREVEKKRARRTLDAHDRRPRPVAPPKKSKPGGLAGLAHSIVKAAAQVPIGAPIPGMSIRAGEFAHPGRLARSQAHGFAEATGINAVRRIRKGEGGWMDKAQVATMFLPGVGRAVGAARMAPKFGIIEGGLPLDRLKSLALQARKTDPRAGAHPRMIDLMHQGAKADTVNFGSKNLVPDIQASARALPAAGKPLRSGHLYQLPHSQGKAMPKQKNSALDSRLAIITDKETGVSFIGQPGDHHGDVIRKAKQHLDHLYAQNRGSLSKGAHGPRFTQSEVYAPEPSYDVPARINWGVWSPRGEAASHEPVVQSQFRIINNLRKAGHKGIPQGRVSEDQLAADSQQLTDFITATMPPGGMRGLLADPAAQESFGMSPSAAEMLRQIGGRGHRAFGGSVPGSEAAVFPSGFFAPESHNPWKLSDVAKRKRAAAKAKTVRYEPKVPKKPTRKGRKLNAVDMERARALAVGAKMKDEHDRRKKKKRR